MTRNIGGGEGGNRATCTSTCIYDLVEIIDINQLYTSAVRFLEYMCIIIHYLLGLLSQMCETGSKQYGIPCFQ